MATAYIALGSNLSGNLDNPAEQLLSALSALTQLPQTQVKKTSSFYQSKPLGPQDQPDYINAVTCIETELPPLELLDALQHIENHQGRVRTRRWGERTLDLDILLYDQVVMNTERLILPHYDMQNREFVIVPLYEIAPKLAISSEVKLSDLHIKFKNHQMNICNL